MKKILITLSMLIISNQAHAFMSKTDFIFDEDLTPQVSANESDYQLDSFKIGKGSYLLPPSSQIATGSVQINQDSNELTLTMERKYFCPANTICTLQMPMPTAITLPIVYAGMPFCGGNVMIAEGQVGAEQGSYIKVQILDENGNQCQNNADDTTFIKRIKVIVTEQANASEAPIVSNLSGFPTQF